MTVDCKTKEAPILVRWMLEDTLNKKVDPSPVSVIRMKRTAEGKIRIIFSIKHNMDDSFNKRLKAYNDKKNNVTHT